MAGIQNESDTSTVQCALCAHFPLPALVFTATTQHVSQQQTLLPVCHPYSLGYQLGHSCGHRDGNTFQVSFPTQQRSGGSTAGLLHGGL